MLGLFNLIRHGLNRSQFSGREAHVMIYVRAGLSKKEMKLFDVNASCDR